MFLVTKFKKWKLEKEKVQKQAIYENNILARKQCLKMSFEETWITLLITIILVFGLLNSEGFLAIPFLLLGISIIGYMFLISAYNFFVCFFTKPEGQK